MITKMRKRNIVFFVDALPYWVLEKNAAKEILSDFCEVRKMAPSIGYSINVHQELFSGRVPDAVGYLGERRIRKNPNRYGLYKLRSVSSELRKISPRLDRYLRPVWNYLLKSNTQFIPLDLIDWYDESIPYPLIQNDKALFFNNSGWDCAIADRTGLAGEDADNKAIQLAWSYLRHSNKDIFIALLNIDALGHTYGNPSNEVESASMNALKEYRSMVQSLDIRGELGSAYLLSDHGMSNVTRIIDLRMEYRIPGCGKRWICYYDSLYFKAWSDSSAMLDVIKDELRTLPGKILGSMERKRLGVTSRSFGDILFVLNEGNAFAPNFFGRGAAKAYHGYIDYGEMQYGVFVTNTGRGNIESITPIEAYQQMTSSFSG